MNEIALLLALLDGVNALIPKIQQMRLNGEISAEDQDKVMTRYKSLKDNLDDKFSGPEWQV